MSKTHTESSSPDSGGKSSATAGGKKSSKGKVKKPLMMAAAGLMVTILLLSSFAFWLFGAGVATVVGLASVKVALLVALPEGQKRSGKSGTVVWKRNGQMRVNAIPRVVRNAFTTAVRATLSSFSSGWNSLSQSDQNSWLTAEGFKTTNRLGQDVILKGKTLYTQLNTNLELIAGGTINVAPSPAGASTPLFSASPVADVSSSTIDMNLSNAEAGVGLVVEATSKTTFGTNSPGNNRFRSFYAANDSTLIDDGDIWNAYGVRFGVPVAGDIIFIRAKYVNNVTGEMSGISQAWKVEVQA